MEMTKRERRAARAFDDSRPAMKHDVRSFISRSRLVCWLGLCCCVAVCWFQAGRCEKQGDEGWAHTAHHRTTQGLRRQN